MVFMCTETRPGMTMGVTAEMDRKAPHENHELGQGQGKSGLLSDQGKDMERATRLELATFRLGAWRSTN